MLLKLLLIVEKEVEKLIFTMSLTVVTLSLNAGMVVKLCQYLKFERIHTINDNQQYCTKFRFLEKPKNLYFN